MKDKVRMLREEPGFVKLFRMFQKKYYSLSRIGGTVSLSDFTKEELTSIAGFVGKSPWELSEKGKLSLLEFEKALARSAFSEYTLLSLMEEVLQEKIVSKMEEQVKEQQEEVAFLVTLKNEIPDAEWWITHIEEKTSDTRWIWSQYKQNPSFLKEQIVLAYRGFSKLPREGQYEQLPFFSQRITGNPHFFDNNELAGRLLHHMMFVDQVLKGNPDLTMPRTTEELNDLLALYGLYRDDLWNFVTCQQLYASMNGASHPVWEAAVKSKTVLNVPMKELLKIDKVWPVKGNRVWVVENSGVSSAIMDQLPTAPVVCTHGQVRMAGWRLLDLLVESGSTLYYSGDMDPEGLVIADKIKQRYKEKAVLWKMDVGSYEKTLSNEDIADRLSKLEAIQSEELIELREQMRVRKLASYQEALVSELVEEIEGYVRDFE